MEYKEGNPRKKSHRNKKTNRRGRKGGAGKAIALVFVLLLVAGVGVILSLTVFFKINIVKVTGNAVYSEKQLINASGVKTGDNLFLTTENKISSNLLKDFPFVEDVSVKRILPDVLTIEITEAREKFCYKINDNFYSVSDKGKVLESYSACPEGLILVTAVSVTQANKGEQIAFNDETEHTYYTKLIETLDKYKVWVSRIDLTDPLGIKVRADNRFDVNFGSLVDIDGKTAHLSKMIQEIEKNKTGTINLSAWSAEKDEAYFVQGNLQ